MKHAAITLLLALSAMLASAQEISLPTLDAKTLGMGGVAMTTLSSSHAIYGNSAMASFSRSSGQISSSYYGQGNSNYYAISGFSRFGTTTLMQLGWRQYLNPLGVNNMALDLGCSFNLGERWAVGLVMRYSHQRLLEVSTFDAFAVDLSVGWSLPLENIGSYSTLRAGAKLGNVGRYFKAEKPWLPMDLTAGVALETFLSDAHQITVGTDMGCFFTAGTAQRRGFQLSVGAEYNLMQLVQLRAGYHYGERQEFYSSYASVGAGVRFIHLRLDFAYLFAQKDSPMRNTYSFSFGFDF